MTPNPAGKIDSFLRSVGSPMAGQGKRFVESGRRHGVDPFLIVAITGAETSFGTSPNTGSDVSVGHNAWGWGPHIKFGSWGEAIDRVANGLHDIYTSKGLDTPEKIGPKWAPSSDGNNPSGWAQNVRAAYQSVSGGKAALVKDTGFDKVGLDKGGIGAGSQVGAPAPNTTRLQPASPGPVSAQSDVLGRASAIRSVARRNLSHLASGDYDADAALSDMATSIQELPEPTMTLPEIPEPISNASPHQTEAPAVPGPELGDADTKKWVVLGPSMDRSGVPTHPQVIQTVARIAQVFGSPLTIGTGSNHNQHVKGSGRESDHWFGQGADIPATGSALTKLGQAALIEAGMDPKEAHKQKGGVYNVNGRNILFNTEVGGNHYNHLHVGLGRLLGRQLPQRGN